VQESELDDVLESMDRYFPRNSWIGLISTAGVYRNHQGAWVTKESACNALPRVLVLFNNVGEMHPRKCACDGGCTPASELPFTRPHRRLPGPFREDI
jgi:hypothetical protein